MRCVRISLFLIIVFSLFSSPSSFPRVKLLANDSTSDGGSTRSKVRCQSLFQDKMNELGTKIGPIEKKFLDKCNQKIMTNLTPSLKKGAKKAHSSAMTTVHSWGSKSRRSK